MEEGTHMSSFVLEDREASRDAARLWWVFLVTGIIWLLVSLIVFRFDYTSVNAIAILFGIVCLGAGINEFFRMASSTPGWKITHALVGILFIVIGIVAFVHPGDTFRALAAVMSFFFILAGIFEIIISIATHKESPHWWLGLITGIIMLALGFWAAGYYGHSAILLIVWVGAIALIRGVTEVVFAFKLKHAGEELA
jgi:uncharacterized membrane protein HdeD (DUF308 family)